MSLTGSSEDELGIEREALFPGKVRKKAVHNQVERRRKDKINGWIIQIGELLPEKDPKKQSKNGILERAVEYILYLKETNKKLMLGQCNEVQAETVIRFEKRVSDLEQQNKSYLKLLKKAGITPLTPLEEEIWKLKNGKYPKNLTPEQVSALQNTLNQNGFLNKDNLTITSVEAKENANTTNCPISSQSISVGINPTKPVSKSKSNHVPVSKDNPLGKSTNKCRNSNGANKNNASKSQSCKMANSVSLPSVSRSDMVLTQALPTEPLMSTTQNISLVQQSCNSKSLEPAITPTLVGANDCNAVVNSQQTPLLVINDQSIPLVQNMLTFQSKPLVLGNEPSIVPQQFAAGSAIEILNSGSNPVPGTIQKAPTAATMCVRQNPQSTVQSNISLPVVISGNQVSSNCATLVPGTNNLVIRPQDASTTTFLNTFCNPQDGSQLLQHSPSSKNIISLTNTCNGTTLANSVLPIIGQTMAFNQPGQVITFGPGTILATPSQTGPLQTQQSWPSALLLPNGQIIPVVSQPSVVYSNQASLNGSLMINSNPSNNPPTHIQTCSLPSGGVAVSTISPQKTPTSLATKLYSTSVSTSVNGSVINNNALPSNVQGYMQKGNDLLERIIPVSPKTPVTATQNNFQKATKTQSNTASKKNASPLKKRVAVRTKNVSKETTKATKTVERKSSDSANKISAPVSVVNVRSNEVLENKKVKSPATGKSSKEISDTNSKTTSKELVGIGKELALPTIQVSTCETLLEKDTCTLLSTDILAKATESIFSSTMSESLTSEFQSNTPGNAKLRTCVPVTTSTSAMSNNMINTLTRETPIQENSKNGSSSNSSINKDSTSSKSPMNKRNNVDCKEAKKVQEKRINEHKICDTSEPLNKKSKTVQRVSVPVKEKTNQPLTTCSQNLSSNNGQGNLHQTESISSSEKTSSQESITFSATSVSDQVLHSNSLISSPSTTHESCTPNVNIGSFVNNNQNCATDHELPALILNSLGEENDEPSVHTSCANGSLQYLSLSPSDHFTHELPIKENLPNSNSFERIRHVTNNGTNVSVGNSPFCNEPSRQIMEPFIEQNACNKANSNATMTHQQRDKKNSTTNEPSIISHSSSTNSIHNELSLQLPNVSTNNSMGLENKQPRSLTHLSVTNSFLTSHVTTQPINSSQACQSPAATVYSSMSHNTMQQSHVRPFITTQSSQNLVNLPIQDDNQQNNSSNSLPTGSGNLHVHVGIATNSCYSNASSTNKDLGNLQRNNLTSTSQVPQSHNSGTRPLQPSPFNNALDRNLSSPKSRTVPPHSSTRLVPSTLYPGINGYNNISTNNNISNSQSRFAIPVTSATASTYNHSISNYSAEALIGHHNVSSSANAPPNIQNFNTSQEIHFSQNITLPTPTFTQSSNRPLLSYSAESLLQNQPNSERKKESARTAGNENSYTQHFQHMRSPTRAPNLMSQNETFSQAMFPPCSTFPTSNSLQTSEYSSVCQLSAPTSTSTDTGVLQSTNYGSSNQQFGNHFGSAPFLMRHLPPPPHMPEVSHNNHRTNTQPPFTIGCAINSNVNEFSFKNDNLTTRNPSTNGNQNMSTSEIGQHQQPQNPHQRNGCLFPSSSSQSIHASPVLPMSDSHFPILSTPHHQNSHNSTKNDSIPMLNHYPPTQTPNHAVNNFLPGQFVQGMTSNHELHLDTNNHSYSDNANGKKESRGIPTNVSRNSSLGSSSKTVTNKSGGKNASKRKVGNTEGNQIAPPTLTLGSYDKSHNIPYFSVPELSAHSDSQSCSINRFFPGCQRTNVPSNVNHQSNRVSSHTTPPVSAHIPVPAISTAPDLSRNSPYNPLFRPQSQSSLNLNFQTPSFSMNPLQRVPTTSGSSMTNASNSILPCQLSSNGANNSACASAPHHVPNFNLSNIFPDISAGTSTDNLTNALNPMKFHPTNSIIPHPSSHHSSAPTQGSMDISSISHGTGHQNRPSMARPPPLYHSRATHPPPPVIHNSFNGILGSGNHAFDRSSGQMVMSMSNNTGGGPPHFGHPSNHPPPPFGNVLPTLNFPVHDTH